MVMTEELFRADAYAASAEARVVACDERGVVLDRTVFYPRGGGQAGDSGTLVRADGSSVCISDTVKAEGQILHVSAAPLEPGETVTARIDRERRHRARG